MTRTQGQQEIVHAHPGRPDEGRDIGKEMLFNVTHPFYRQPGLNPFFIDYGRTTYQLKNIYFYDDDGIVYHNDKGWFSNGYGSNPYKGLGFSEDVKLKRKRDFDGSVFIMSEGKGEFNRNVTYCGLYIPMDYLKALGYKVVRDIQVDTKQHITTTRMELHTRYFTIHLFLTTEEDFEAQKRDFVHALNACTNREELKEVLDTFYWLT